MERELAKIPLFSDLKKAEIKAITDSAITRTYPKNTVIIHEGDTSDSLYVILSGKVKVYVSNDSGREVILGVQGSGEYFGEMALIDEMPRSASVMTMVQSKFCILSKALFESCLIKNPTIALKLLRTQSLRVRRLTLNVKNLALLDVYGRVARALLNMATQHDDGMVIEHRLTHQDIAKMVGASREMVSRIMKDLSEGGYIRSEGHLISISERLPTAW